MGCDPYYPTAPTPWEQVGIEREDWFNWYPLHLRAKMGQPACTICGALVSKRSAGMHIAWHKEQKEQAQRVLIGWDVTFPEEADLGELKYRNDAGGPQV